MRLFALLALHALPACGSPSAPAPPPPADARPRIAKIGEHQVDIIVAGEHFTTLSEDELAAGTRLDLLVSKYPYASWTTIELRGPDKDPVLLMHPADGYAGLLPRVGYRAGTRTPAFELSAAWGDASERYDGVDEIRIEIAPPERSALDALRAGCTKHEKGMEKAPKPPKRWHGRAYQFNTQTNWVYDMTLDLSDGPLGEPIGVIRAHGSYYDLFTTDCVSDLYRAPDRNGQRVAVERVRPGGCVDGTMTFVCDGPNLAIKSFYVSGQYVLYGTLSPQP